MLKDLFLTKVESCYYFSHIKRVGAFLALFTSNTLPLQQNLAEDLLILCVSNSSLPILQTGLHPLPILLLTLFLVAVTPMTYMLLSTAAKAHSSSCRMVSSLWPLTMLSFLKYFLTWVPGFSSYFLPSYIKVPLGLPQTSLFYLYSRPKSNPAVWL